MNYPMKEGQIDPAFVGKVAFSSQKKPLDVYDILLAAQEVMQEMDTSIKIGDKVRYENDLGVVHDCHFPEIDDRHYAFVIFADGSRGIYLKEHLTKIEEASE